MENSKFVKISLIASGIALATSIVVLIISLTSNNSGSDSSTKNSGSISVDSTGIANVAYINLDTLLLEYKYSIKLNEDFLTEQAKAKGNLESRMKSFEKKYNEFSEKMRLGSFISQASMETQQNELMQEQTNIQKLEEDLTNQLLEQQAAMNAELYDTVMNFVKEFNKDGRYMLILGNAAGSSILYAEPGMDITREVLDQLNERYAKSQAGK
ncbi:MAG: OmpH family outer membrane protein [Bacteroidales bacterium]|nr:OmpH family outer membrane protein [Bacteroidales bacterium]MDD3859631.1 OmpH family outer membrane protein [Bacteroidales bacterium]